MSWSYKIIEISDILKKLAITNNEGDYYKVDNGFELIKNLLLKVRATNTVFCVGNGASASMASHLAADIANNGMFKSHVFFDSSLITAISNDYGYEEVFAKPLSCMAKEGDVLIAISSSGESRNIIKSTHTAKQKKMTVITFTAMSKDNSLRKLGDYNFYVPAATYGNAESTHAILLHYLVDLVIDS